MTGLHMLLFSKSNGSSRNLVLNASISSSLNRLGCGAVAGQDRAISANQRESEAPGHLLQQHEAEIRDGTSECAPRQLVSQYSRKADTCYRSECLRLSSSVKCCRHACAQPGIIWRSRSASPMWCFRKKVNRWTRRKAEWTESRSRGGINEVNDFDNDFTMLTFSRKPTRAAAPALQQCAPGRQARLLTAQLHCIISCGLHVK